MDRIAGSWDTRMRRGLRWICCATWTSSARTTVRFSSTFPIPGWGAVGPELDFRGDDPEPASTVAALNGLGYREPHDRGEGTAMAVGPGTGTAVKPGA